MLRVVLCAFLAVTQANAEQDDRTQAQRLQADTETLTGGSLFVLDVGVAEAAALDQVAADHAALRVLVAQKQLNADAALAEARRWDARHYGIAQAEAQYRADLTAALGGYERAIQASYVEWAGLSSGVWAQRGYSADAMLAAIHADVTRAAQRAGVHPPAGQAPWYPGGGAPYGIGPRGWSGAGTGQALQVAGEYGERFTLAYSDGGIVRLIRQGATVSACLVAVGAYPRPTTKRIVFSDGMVAEVTRHGAVVSARVLTTGTPVSPSMCVTRPIGREPYGSGGAYAYQTAGVMWQWAAGGGSPAPPAPGPVWVPPVGAPSALRPPSLLDDPNAALAPIARFDQQVTEHRLAYLNALVGALGRADADIAAGAALSPAQRSPALAGAIEALRQSGVAAYGTYRQQVEQAARDLDGLVARPLI